jgi:hypothetical protein
MGKTTLLWRAACSLTLLVMLSAGLSCAVRPQTRPRAWIDVPKDGAEVRVNTPVGVTAHVYAQDGVAEITLSVDGQLYVRTPPLQAGATYAVFTQEWLPAAPGEYVLQVRAYDTKGEVSNPASIRVAAVTGATLRISTPTVEAFPPAPAEEPTDTPIGAATQMATGTAIQTATGTATRAPTGTAVHSPTGTATSTETSVPSPTVAATSMPTTTPSPIPPAEVSFWVEQDSITSGGCTVVHWDVEHATTVQLDGAGVAGHGTKQVCPLSTTTYHLHVVAPSGDVDRNVTVTVTAPPDTTPPSISNITESADPIRPPDCSPNSVTISATITDPSGVPKRDLYYRVVGGVWLWRSMSPAGGDVYQTALGDGELSNSLSPYEDADALQYYIKAWDSKANMSQSPTLTVGIVWCVP